MQALMTGTSRNLKRTLDYIGDKTTKAHRNDNGVKKRNIALAGVGVRTDGVQNTYHDFLLLTRKRPHTKVKTLNYVISPKKNEVDANDPEQVRNFKRYCSTVARKFLPNHFAYLAIQHDNKNDVLHCHIIFSNISTDYPHHAVNHSLIRNARFQKIAEEVRLNGFSGSKAPLRLSHVNQKGEDWRTDKTIGSDLIIKGKAQDLMDDVSHSKNHPEVRKAGKRRGLLVRFPRKQRHRAYKMYKGTDGKFHYATKTRKNGKKHKIPLYKKKSDGSYYYKRNAHGNKHRVPLYVVTQGIMFKLDPKKYGKNPWRNGKYFGIHGTDVQATLDRNKQKSKRSVQSAKKTAKKHKKAKISTIKPPTAKVIKDTSSNVPKSDQQFEASLPDIKPTMKSMSANQTETLRNDLELSLTLSKPDKSAKNDFASKVKANHKKHGISMNRNDADYRPIFQVMENIITATRLDAHRLKIACRHYEKAIARYLSEARKKAIKATHKAKTKATKTAKKFVHSNTYQDLMSKLQNDGEVSKQRKAKTTRQPRKVNHAKKPQTNRAELIGRKNTKRRAERAKNRRTRYRNHHSNNQAFDR